MRFLRAILIFATVLSLAVVANAKGPVKFVTQVLEPTGGKIQRPADWFYRESHNSTSYIWTISREDSGRGPYITGLRIQTVVGIEKGTGKSPKQFVMDFIRAKEKKAKVLEKCTAKDQGMFTRICLRTEEGPFRIQYSLFWGNGADIVVFVTYGTKKELWDKYASTFDRMESFELIDMKRFTK